MTQGKRALVGRLYVDDKFAALEKRLDERATALAKALELQRKETDRRLEILNHAHEQALEERALTVQQDTHDVQMRDITRRIDENAKALRVSFLALASMILALAGWLVFR